MVYRVVSTKLTEEEHGRLLDICNRNGCTPSSYIKQAVLDHIEAEEDAISDGTHESCIKLKEDSVGRSELDKLASALNHKSRS